MANSACTIRPLLSRMHKQFKFGLLLLLSPEWDRSEVKALDLLHLSNEHQDFWRGQMEFVSTDIHWRLSLPLLNKSKTDSSQIGRKFPENHTNEKIKFSMHQIIMSATHDVAIHGLRFAPSRLRSADPRRRSPTVTSRPCAKVDSGPLKSQQTGVLLLDTMKPIYH